MEKWNQYYLNVCNTIAENSSCFSRKIGAIIVKDKSIISTGYNGPPRGVPHCDKRIERILDDEFLIKETLNLNEKCPRKMLGYKSGEGLHLCVAGHAERNALINAARNGIAVNGATMYMNCPIPCKDCLIEIINAGIEKIVVTGVTYYDDMSKFLVLYSNLKIDMYE